MSQKSQSQETKMDVDIDKMAKGVGLFSAAITAIKQTLELLPNTPSKAEAAAALAQAEREFKSGEAKLAKDLKYQLCRNHFPPEIMLSKDNKTWRCEKCNNTLRTEETTLSWM